MIRRNSHLNYLVSHYNHYHQTYGNRWSKERKWRHGCGTQCPHKSYNVNSNNSSGRQLSQLSDWEEFDFGDKDEIESPLDDLAFETCFFSKEPRDKPVSHDNDYDNYYEDNFELVPPVNNHKDPKDIENSKYAICEYLQKTSIQHMSIVHSFKDNIFELFKVKSIMMIIYFIISNLQDLAHYTMNYVLWMIEGLLILISLTRLPLKIISQKSKELASFIFCKYKKRKKNCADINKLKVNLKNSNNNALFQENEPKNTLFKYKNNFYFYLILIFIMVSGIIYYMTIINDSKGTSIKNIFTYIKLKLLPLFHEVYILPGEHCMRAGKCKAAIESTFRWLTCLFTLPVRTVLTSWVSVHTDNEDVYDDKKVIKKKIDQFILDFLKSKSRIKKQQQSLKELLSQFSKKQMLMKVKSEEVLKIDDSLQIVKKIIDTIINDIATTENQVRNLNSIQHNLVKNVDKMKLTTDVSKSFVKDLISKFKYSIESEHHQWEKKIHSFESMLKEWNERVKESLNELLLEIKLKLNVAKISNNGIREKFLSVKDLSLKYSQMSLKLKEDIKDSLTYEMALHEQLSMRTETGCTKELNKFKANLDNLDHYYECMIKNLIDEQSKTFFIELKREIATNFYDKIVDIVNQTTDERLSTLQNHESFGKPVIKAAGFLSEKGNIQIVSNVCHQKTNLLLNLSSSWFCEDKLKEIINKDQECLTKDQVVQKVQDAVLTYLADKTGMVDYALESMGGSVIAAQSSFTYNGPLGLFSFMSLPRIKRSNSLRVIIQPSNQPGDCWPFAGSVGHVVIKLSHKITVKAVTLEHLPTSLSPNGEILTAPHFFNIYSLPEITGEKEILLGAFEYLKNDSAIQTFMIYNPQPTTTILMKVLTNYGNKEYTCIYRLRVHGS